jgi:hypothetical protein
MVNPYLSEEGSNTNNAAAASMNQVILLPKNLQLVSYKTKKKLRYVIELQISKYKKQ